MPGKCAFHSKVSLVPGLLAWIIFDAIFPEKSWKWNERGIPVKNFLLRFDTSHLLQLSTNRFFRVNGKKPEILFCDFFVDNARK